MATPNYAYEKRQRELAKKRKKEEKAARKTTPGQPNPSGETANNAAEGGERASDIPPGETPAVG